MPCAWHSSGECHADQNDTDPYYSMEGRNLAENDGSEQDRDDGQQVDDDGGGCGSVLLDQSVVDDVREPGADAENGE